MNKALIMTLENCIIGTKSGDIAPVDNDDWKFNLDIVPRIKQFANEGYIVCIAVNMAAIERGMISSDEFEAKMDLIKEELGNMIDDNVNYIFCPFLNHYYRKPNPGMAYALAIKLELDLPASIMVGNTKKDQEFAYNSGIGEYITVKNFIENGNRG